MPTRAHDSLDALSELPPGKTIEKQLFHLRRWYP